MRGKPLILAKAHAARGRCQSLRASGGFPAFQQVLTVPARPPRSCGWPCPPAPANRGCASAGRAGWPAAPAAPGRRGRWNSAPGGRRRLGQGVDVQLVHDALDPGLDPAVAVQRPVDAPGHQRLVVHPGDGGRELARRLRGARRQQPVAARNVDFAVQHDAGAVAGGHGRGLAHVVEHLGHRRRSGRWAAPVTVWPGCDAAGGHAAPEHAAALAGVGRKRRTSRPTAPGRRRLRWFRRRRRPAAPATAAATGPGSRTSRAAASHHVVALQRGDRHDGAHRDAGGGGESRPARR